MQRSVTFKTSYMYTHIEYDVCKLANVIM